MSSTVPRPTRVEHTRHTFYDAHVAVEIARYRGETGVEEVHLFATPTTYGSFEDQLVWLEQSSREMPDTLGVRSDSVVFRRFLCSDIANQVGALAANPLSSRTGEDTCAVSWIGQPPAGPAKVALWAYHVNDPAGPLDKRRVSDSLMLRRGDLTHLWTCGLSSPATTSFDQTRGIFEHYESILHERRLTLADDVMRTWLFVRDIDANYTGLVDARRELFARRGLTPDTHYIASTGIEGRGPNAGADVTMDAYAVGGLQAEQVAYVRAPENLNATDAYGVTFERATSIAWRDRTHVLVSGTASINSHGEIVHPGDVQAQTGRTLNNIEALLHNANANREDVCILIAYLRDATDEPLVRTAIRERFGHVPLAVVIAAVCRPGWLVEIEAQAIKSTANPQLPAF